MNARFMRSLAVLALLTGLAGCGSMGGLGGATSLFDQLGGKDAVKSLADSFVNNVASDSRTSSMLSGANVGSLKSKTSDQFCALAGGGCPAPLSSSQITDAGKKVNPQTSSALNDSFSKALDSIKASPLVKESATKLLGPQLGGIVAGLL